VDSLDPCTPKVMFIDIETDNSGRVPRPTIAPEAVLCVTCHIDNVYTSFIWRADFSVGKDSRLSWECLHEVNYFRSEEDMLNALLQFTSTENPDIISGWSVMAFDLMYLVNRMSRLGIDHTKLSPMGKVWVDEKYNEVNIKGVSVVDLLAAYRRFASWTEGLKESYKLDFVGREVAGIGKTDSAANIKWMWKFKPDALIEYNAQDVHICVEIDRKQQLLDFLDELRRLCFCQLEDCLTMTSMADSYILRMFHDRKVFPTRTHHEHYEYEGAIVESWATGIYKDVVVFDIRSLYPSIIVSAGLSPEKIYEGKDMTNVLQLGPVMVKKDRPGFLPEVIETLFKERSKYKEMRKQQLLDSELYKLYNLRQEALKRLLNALYGQTAYPNSRIYNAKVAEAVTWTGRQIITWSKEYLEAIGFKVIYIDTDGLHIVFDNVEIDNIQMILGLLNASYDDFAKKIGLDKHIFVMEFDKIYRRAFYGKTKKRYAGAICYKDGKVADKLDIWGFEVRRSDAAQFSRNMQKRVFDMLLREDSTKEEVLRFVGDEIDRLRKGNCKFTEIGIPKGMTRDLADYGKGPPDKNLPDWKQKGISSNIRGARYAKTELGLELTSKPKLVYISKMSNGHEPIDVLCFDDDSQVPAGTQIDIDLTLEKLVKDKLDGIFEALGWKMSDLVPWWKGKPGKSSGDQMKLDMG